MLSKFLIVLTLIVSSFSQLNQPFSDPPKDQLVLFTSNKDAIVNEEYLEKFKQFANTNELKYVVHHIASGAPEEITLTPTIVFMNTIGRSYYYGRPTNFNRLRTFVRTSRLLHTNPVTNTKENHLVWNSNRATITAPLKITNLNGTLKNSFDQEEFIKCSKEAASKGMQKFKIQESFDQLASNRAFYMNLYPYKGEKNTLAITGEIYSQFNCIDPIYKCMDKPLVEGKWSKRAKLFEEAGKKLEEVVVNLIETSAKPDAFSTIPIATKTIGWERFILESASLKNTPTTTQTTTKIPRHWAVEQIKSTTQPVGAFSFFAPLNGYAGEIKNLTGKLSLNEQGSLSNAQGSFEVQIEDITMGDLGFDKEVHYKMLDRNNHPSSTFIFEKVTGPSSPLKLETPQEIEVTGQFTLKGKSIPLTVPATLTPVYSEEGELRLEVTTAYTLDLFSNFKVKGPDGPSPARDMLKFFMKFSLKPLGSN